MAILQPMDPATTPEGEVFWKKSSQGKLSIKHCNACGQDFWYPRALCPYCFSPDTEWRNAAGKGVIYSFTIMRRTETPFTIAYVTLDEGVTMLTQIVNVVPDAVRIGQTVAVVFAESSGGFSVPLFEPLSER